MRKLKESRYRNLKKKKYYAAKMHYIFAAYLVELYFASQSYIYLPISYIAHGGYICLAASFE